MSSGKLTGTLGSLWGTIGITAFLGAAVYRLGLRALEALHMELGAIHWLVLAVVVVGMAFAEGYRGFQKRFSPRTAARIHYMTTHPNRLRTLLAPLFGMGYFHATRRTKIVAWVFPFGIAALVLLVRLLPQPWRGIVDCGVVVGLTWGIISLLIFVARAFAIGRPPASPEVP